MTGQGRKEFADGEIHEGSSLLDRPNGPCRITDPNGTVEEAEFVNGLMNGEYSK